MAHNLADRTAANATATGDVTGKSFFGVLEGGWHNLGIVKARKTILTLDDALEAAGANYTVSTRPLGMEVGNGDYVTLPEGYRAIVRDDTGGFLGTCKGRYHTLQNRTIFGILQILVDQGKAEWDTGGVLGNGERIFGCVKWTGLSKETLATFKTLGMTARGTVASSHDSSLSAKVYQTETRTVCENTVIMGIAGATDLVNVKHTATGEVKLADAALKVWEKIFKAEEATANAFKMLKAVALDTLTFRKAVLDVAFPLPVIDKTATDRAQKVQATKLDNAIDTRAVITSLWHNGSGHDGDSSAWEAWQGLIQAVDHNNIMPLRSSDIVSANLFGTHGNVKAAVFQSLMAVAGK